MLVCTVLGTLSGILWLFCWKFGHKKYQQYVNAIDEKEYLFSELFPVGFLAMELFRVNVKDYQKHGKLRTLLADLYGEQDVDFYLYVSIGAQYTYVITMIPLGLLLGAVGNQIWMGILLAAVGFGLALNVPQKVEEKCRIREENMQMQLPNVISAMTLLVNTGMLPQQCWEKVSEMGTSELYCEMQHCTQMMKTGITFRQALQYMGDHTNTREVKKFCSTLQQNLLKGDAELTETLLRMNNESWDTKKNLAKRKGELAGQKLLLPTMLMFAALMAMIIVPVFANMSI